VTKRVEDVRRSITVDAGGSVLLTGDEPRLRRIVAYLLANAQGTHASTGPDRGRRSRSLAVLTVIDTGSGIDPRAGRARV
jgi:signal transduction histidine kinase